VGPEAVRFSLEPRQVVTRGPGILGADSILPVIPGAEVPARPSQLRDAQLARRLENIRAVPVGVGQGRALVVHPAIDAPAKMLNEVPVNVGIDGAQTPFKVDVQGGMQRQLTWPAQGAGINPPP